MFEIIFSILLGISLTLILYYLFYPTTVYRGPNSNDVRKQIYRDGDKCYKLKPVIHICPTNISVQKSV